MSLSRNLVLVKQKRRRVDQNLNTDLEGDCLWSGKVQYLTDNKVCFSIAFKVALVDGSYIQVCIELYHSFTL